MYEEICTKLLYFAFYYYATTQNGHTDIKRLNQKIINSFYDGISIICGKSSSMI